MDDQATGQVEAFIDRWRGATGSELANYQPFLGALVELPDLSQVPEVVARLQAGARCSTCLG